MFKYLFLLYLAVLVLGLFEPLWGLAAAFFFLLPIVVLAPFSGRKWCSQACPRGSFQDLFRPWGQAKLPAWLKAPYLRYAIMLLMFSRFIEILRGNWGDWSALGAGINNLMWVSTVVGIVLLAVAPARAWCTICPMGTVGKLLAPAKPTLQVSNACVSCQLCARTCPLGLAPFTAKGDPQGFCDADCMRCGRCVAVCPKQAITLLP
ncbi:MAG: 4Fe-4S binding protein [Acidaminococcaceae bacterium]